MNEMNKIDVVALIPARSGSKGIPNKNIKHYKNITLICHSINIAKESKYINGIIVSTDSELYKEISEKNGARCPFIRPSNISGDLSTDYEFIKHYIQWLQLNSGKISHLNLYFLFLCISCPLGGLLRNILNSHFLKLAFVIL